jgi:hypothetical protein
MKPVYVLAHMAMFSILLLGTLVGLAGVEQEGGGYLWEFLVICGPLIIGMQIQYIINYSGE